MASKTPYGSNVWIPNGEVQRILGISDFTVRRWATKGYLLYKRTPGGHRRFRLDTVAALRRIIDGDTETDAEPDPGCHP